MFKKIKAARAYLDHGDEFAGALVPDDAVVVDAPPDTARPAVDEALDGGHQAAASVLRSTRDSRAWEDRAEVVASLARITQRSPEWLESWLEAAPDDPDALAVDAHRLVDLAWERRSHDDAGKVSPDQFDAFHDTLARATQRIRAAVDASPGDPVPWMLALRHARGLEADRETFDGYLRALGDTDPHHYGASWEAMQFLCQKWFGSHEAMYSFARRAVDSAPADSRVQALLLDAVLEEFATDPSALARDPALVDDALQRAQGYVDAHPDAGHHLTARTRNVLARILFHLERPAEAYAQMEAIGPYATSYPWRYWDDARSEFLTHRAHIVTLRAASS